MPSVFNVDPGMGCLVVGLVAVVEPLVGALCPTASKCSDSTEDIWAWVASSASVNVGIRICAHNSKLSQTVLMNKYCSWFVMFMCNVAGMPK